MQALPQRTPGGRKKGEGRRRGLANPAGVNSLNDENDDHNVEADEV